MKTLSVIGHRGFSGLAPENTMASFRRALEEKVDGIELDVHQTKDEKVIVMHDSTLNRTTTMRGRISDYSYDELKNTDAGSFFSSEFSSERIPLLEEVLKLVMGKAKIYIEVKRGDRPYFGIEKNILDLIRKNKAEQWCILHSFEKDTLQRIHQINQSYPIYLTLYVPGFLSRLYFQKMFWRNGIAGFKSLQGININQEAITPSLVGKMHARGLKVLAWTVNRPVDILRMKKCGVDGIISNYPDRVLSTQ